ncbi:reverse transcriptase [Corchorus capsularis]|uniref:Reverse transcriptase n=1 Tax=Corchorus capsularis TaxID=210143 RepID=A0A1R3IVD7_COCAP|nr:reverse transcriptase [Corchorus capsularis]
MGQQNSTANTEVVKEDGLPSLMESTGGEVEMVLSSDAISLPPQQPPMVASDTLVPNLSNLIHDDMVAEVSARLNSDQNVSAIGVHNPSILAIVEPRISGLRAERVLRKLKFPKWHVADPVGFAGGIWLNWDDAVVHITVIISSAQILHVLVKPKDSEEFLLTVVYASPRVELRRSLWSHIENLARTINALWVVLGDFNDVSNAWEKMGGAVPSLARCNLFNGMITNCGLMDLGFSGPAFTWCNKRKGLRKVQEHLDRVLADPNWQLLFLDAAVVHLPRVYSDHSPILLKMEPGVGSDKTKRPFRFQAMWMADNGFQKMMGNLWKTLEGNFIAKEEKLASALMEWNKSEFGNIFEKKKELRPRISGVQRALANHRSHQLELLEEDLIAQYDKILEQEEGDLQKRVVKYFKELFSIDDGEVQPLSPLPQPILSSYENSDLSKAISFDEVRCALFQMKPWKAPGLMAFRRVFIKSFGVLLVLVNRLRPLFDKLVGPLQSSFIPGRQSADNVFIAQEMIHTIKRSKSKLGLMTIKIDLEKAYDRICWDFLRDTLIAFGFPDSWVKLILFCLESSSMAVLDDFCSASGSKVSLEKSHMYVSPKPAGDNVRLSKVLNLAGRAALGGSEGKRALHLVNWDEVCKPKKYSGLGLRKMEYHNRVLIQKTTWRFITQPQSLWVQCMHAKYKVQGDIFDFIRDVGAKKSAWSSSWRGKVGALDELHRGLKKRVGSGETIHFWTDRWLEVPLIDLIKDLPSFMDITLMISDFMVNEGNWNVDMLFAQLPGDEDILHVLRDCEKAKQVWVQVFPSSLHSTFFSLIVSDWLKQGLDYKGNSSFQVLLGRFMPLCLSPPPAFGRIFAFNGSLLRWILSTYMDGVARGNPGIAGAGGVIRNSAGAWLAGFATHLGTCSNVAAELHALRLGIQLAWREGYRSVLCEVDAKVILDLLHSTDVEFHPLGALFMDIKETLTWD